jgi:dTDP-4-dehydrorhamnose reductase
MTRPIIVTGLNGMLGQKLQHALPQGTKPDLTHDLTPNTADEPFMLVGATSQAFNLLETLDSLSEKLDAYDAAIKQSTGQALAGIVHAAAYTSVDGAESNPDLAMAINREGTKKMAPLAKARDIPLVYISTDYVFDGEQRRPYLPTDKPNPINAYGLSKYYGELMVTELLSKYFIIRTSWVYGEHKNNFVRQVLTAAKAGSPQNVFTDQTGSPTYTGSLVPVIANALGSTAYGTYHACDRGVVSRYEQARIICDMAGLGSDHLVPITTDSLGLPAKRPIYSAMDPGTLPMPDWREALSEYLSISPVFS